GNFTVTASQTPNGQQGAKLVGTGSSGSSQQGYSLALSADGNTAIVGAPADNSNAGAAWVYTRSGGVWTQQGNKLVGTGSTGASQQGFSVAISADGNTAIVGAPVDNSNAGAAWVFTRSGGVWSQQGTKLIGSGALGSASQGWSVGLSADGNTAMVGGQSDNSSVGAVWVYTRSGGVWNQQGAKLVGTGNIGMSSQGTSVRLSADGNIAIVGGYNDNSKAGAAWMYSRNNGVWTQSGVKLIGSGAAGSSQFGFSAAISADGNTAIIGGNIDNSAAGAAWVYSYVTPLTPPTITSFNPITAKPGDVVTITGTNFNTTTTNNIVFFGATRATVTAATTTSLTVTVPSGATYAPITVLNIGTSLAAYSLRNFTPVYSPAKTNITATDFQAKQDFATGTNAYSVAIGDLDGDGKSDLAVTNRGSNTVSIFRSTTTSGSIGSGSFADKVDFTTGTTPYAVSIGDLDGDGKPDLAVTNFGSSSVSVFRNTSTSGSISSGSFAAKVDFTTGLRPFSVAIGDLDGDGKPDLAVANQNSNTVSVFRNISTNGSIESGSFAAKVDFATGDNPREVAIGDLDGDSKPDLAVANFTSSTVSVFRNTATTGSINTSSFANKVDFTTGTNPRSVAIGDLDGDGKPDLVVANQSSSNISVFHNTSTGGSIEAGSFAAKVDFTIGTTPGHVSIGDFDGDGKADLAVVWASNTVSVFRNTASSGSIGSGSFADKIDFTTGTGPASVAIGDLDGDGKADLAVANFSSNNVSVLRNAEIQLPPIITSFSPINAKPGDVVTITGTNFNTTTTNNTVFFGATRATVTAATATSLTVTIPSGATYAPITVLNTGTSLAAYSLRNFTPVYSPTKTNITAADFQAKVDFATEASPRSFAVGDLDGDGKPDLVVANLISNIVSVYRSTASSGSIGSGSFATKVDFATGDASPVSVAIGDIDGDGKPDLVVANSASNTVSVFRNTSTSGSIGSGSFAAKVDFTTGDRPQSLAIGDLDGDGKPDLVIANLNSNTVSVFRNTASSGSINTNSFAAKVDFTTGVGSRSVAIGDLDGDGKPDLAVANVSSNTVSVFRNTATSGSINTNSFAAKVDFITGSSPQSVAIGDLDGDGKHDLAVINSSSNTVSIFRNTATSGSIEAGSFTAKVDFTTGSAPHSVTLGDINGDSKLDLTVTNFGSNTISVFRNTASSGSISTNSFAAKIDFTSGTGPVAVAIGDIDGDSKPDLVVANNNSRTLSIFQNIELPPPPTITSFVSTSGPVGTLVTITGTNLGNPTSITIGGVAAIPISNTGTSLVAMVMPGA
ncbi:beta strand repeat-containing protein, partial [Sediminibacterium sp.]|uniref:beta strand repeat-containing protein n=1 Tax=Sediminibacterium sp. TaxID=1917865 RepID=UPI003F6FCFFE